MIDINKIKFCIWDVGGVIYDYNFKALDEYFRSKTMNPEKYKQSLGVLKFDYDSYMKGEISHEEFCRELCEKYDVIFTTDMPAKIDELLHDGVGEYFSETNELMQEMESNGVESGLLSNALPALLDTVDSENMFLSFELGMLKPDLAIYEEMRKRLGCRFEEIIFVDDKEENITAAVSLGINGIVYDRKTIKSKFDSFRIGVF